MDELQDKELTEQIIAAAIDVHRQLGPGFLESVYEEALCMELRHRGIPFERQKTIDIPFRGEKIAVHRLDLLVDSKVIVELKAVKTFEPIFYAILRSYLNAAKMHTGLLINFNAVPLAVKRVGREYYGHS
jgi:GxxExxY protein